MRTVTVPDPMEAPAINWGIIAPGHIAIRFAREIPQYTKSRILAVGSRELSRSQAFANEHGIERAYGSYAELVADPEVDAIYVANPHSEHHSSALLALEAGKPVLVEKSFTMNAQQATEVFERAQAQNCYAAEAMWSRYLPHYQQLRMLVEDGCLGELVFAGATHCQSLKLHPERRLLNPALAGGALLDLGIYPISFLHYVMGTPTAISATGTLTDTGVDLRAAITLQYENAHYAMAYADMSARGGNAAEIIGTQGRIDVPGWFYRPQDITFTPFNGDPITFHTKVEGGFQYQAAEAARCIKEGRTQTDAVTWKDTVEVLQITDAIRAQLGVVFPQER